MGISSSAGRAALLFLLAAPLAGQTQGYVARACGFDMNFNGVRGEAADCNVCDHASGSSTADEDLDGNTVTDRQVYVDCTSGSNSASCGTPSSPCATVSYALAGTNSSVTGGPIGSPSATQIQAVCIQGTCAGETLTIASGTGGAATAYTVSATGNQVRDWEYPRYPLIISGWDADGDDAYPPFDTDDTAVLDGNSARPWWANNNNESYYEIAHLDIIDYGDGGGANEAVAEIHQVGSGGDHMFLHDFEANTWDDDIGIRADADDNDWLAFENFQVDFDGFVFWRGFAGDGGAVSGPVRWQNITINKTSSSTTDGSAFSKTWGDWTGIEVLDSVFSCTDQPVNHGIRVKDCNQDFVIRNNTVTDCELSGINIESDAGGGECTGRHVDDVVIDRNTLINTLGTAGSGGAGIYVQSGASTNTTQDLTITNNFIVQEGANAWQAGMLFPGTYGGSGDVVGTWSIVGNTIRVDSGGTNNGLLRIGIGGDTGSLAQDDVILRNNIFDNQGAAGDTLVACTSLPANFSADYNVYPSGASDGGWDCGGTTSTLSTWQTNSGEDGNAARCDPTYVSAADFHLQASDSCALDIAVDPGTGVTVCPGCVDADVDGDSRPQAGVWDVGADEVQAAALPAAVVSGAVMSGVSVQ